MPSLRPLKLRQVIRALEKCGFACKSQKGSHAKFVHPDGRTTIVLIRPQEIIGRGLLKEIITHAKIPVEEFFRWTWGIGMPKTSTHKKSRTSEILSLFKKIYPRAWCTLEYADPFQLLVSTILSAQCTDARVNMITPALFARFPDARAMAKADVGDLEALIRSSGFYHSKAKNILAASKIIAHKHAGKVPADMPSLLELPGVARKTANIVLFHAFGKEEGIAVDTHCMRISYRLGFTSSRDKQNQIERELMALIPRETWGNYTNWMVSHGRKYCMARKPDCKKCPLDKWCPKKGMGGNG